MPKVSAANNSNEQTIDREGRITTDDSQLHAYVIPVEEGLLIAQQAAQCLKKKKDEGDRDSSN